MGHVNKLLFTSHKWDSDVDHKNVEPKAIDLDSRAFSFTLCLIWRYKIGKQDREDIKDSVED